MMSTALTRKAEFVRGMRRLGAVGPESARARSELPDLPLERFEQLVQSGLLREATSGRYYLFESALSSALAPELPVVGVWRRSVRWIALVISLVLAFLLYVLLRG